ELGVRLEVRGIRVEETGEALLPTSRLVSILREATDEELTIEASPESCIIRTASAEFEMPGEDPAAFPDIPSFAEEKYHEINGGLLREMTRRTCFAAAAAEHSRFGATTGILLQ